MYKVTVSNSIKNMNPVHISLIFVLQLSINIRDYVRSNNTSVNCNYYIESVYSFKGLRVFIRRIPSGQLSVQEDHKGTVEPARILLEFKAIKPLAF